MHLDLDDDETRALLNLLVEAIEIHRQVQQGLAAPTCRHGSSATVAPIGRALALEGVEQHLIAAAGAGAALVQRVVVGPAGILAIMVAVPVVGIERELASDSRDAGHASAMAPRRFMLGRCLIGSCRQIGGL